DITCHCRSILAAKVGDLGGLVGGCWLLVIGFGLINLTQYIIPEGGYRESLSSVSMLISQGPLVSFVFVRA
ncbi:MAG TPA: hypothetical protein PKX04_08005, partial [Chitinophagales bacterium]|nr:hypothetical protein [Chitinophagales bacterium]HRX24077.1 hypothetical protein [Chitinophagales bacterium]